MKTREQRIEAFINSLETVETDGIQSILLSSDMCVLGGGTDDKIVNSGDCSNSGGCSNTENGGACQNYDQACGGSTNRGACSNKPKRDEEIHPPVFNFQCK